MEADWLAAGLIILAAFLAASYAPRNSDVWLNLATAKQLLQGNYTFGSDPFSFTGAGRVWVDTSWLYSVGFYGLFSLDSSGGLAVATKAVLFAAAFVVLFFLRKSEHPVWPWVITGILGVLAALPSALMRPYTMSIFFLSLTLALIYLGKDLSRKRFLTFTAVLTVIWANTDAWFILAPFTLALVLLGELLSGNSGSQPATPTKDGESATPSEDEEADPFRPFPAVKTLALALAVSVAACLANPSTLIGLVKQPGEALAQLVPAELPVGYPNDAYYDVEFGRLFLSPFSTEYTSRPEFGYSINGLAAALLLVFAGLGMALAARRQRVADIILWLGFLALAIIQYRLIAMLAIVAVPVAASHWNAFSMALKVLPGSPAWSILSTLSGVGRILTVTVSALMLISAWPGWLQYQHLDPIYHYRTDWNIPTNPGLARTANLIKQWEDDTELAPDTKALAVTAELGNYLAWMTPEVKSFMTSRYRFHREELGDLMQLREAVGISGTQPDQRPYDPETVLELCDKYDARYLTIVRGTGRSDVYGMFQLSEGLPGWRLWHLDGRSIIIGPTGTEQNPAPRFDPVRIVFSKSKPPEERPRTVPTLPRPRSDSLLEPFLTQPTKPDIAADDAVVLSQYWELNNLVEGSRWQQIQMLDNLSWAAGVGVPLAVIRSPQQQIASDDSVALPILIARHFGEAVAVNQDRPEPYQALTMALQSPYAPVTDDEDRTLQLTAANYRFLQRVPPYTRCSVAQAFQAFQASQALAQIYQNSGQWDFARQALLKGMPYAELVAQVNPVMFRQMLPPDTEDKDLTKLILENLNRQLDSVESETAKRNDAFQTRMASMSDPLKRFQLAIQLGLPGKAIEVFEYEDPSMLGSDALNVAFMLIDLQLRAGRIAEAYTNLDALQENLDASAAQSGGVQGLEPYRLQARLTQAVIDKMVGNYRQSREEILESAAGQIQQIPEAMMGWLDGNPVRTPSGLWGVAGLAAALDLNRKIDPAVTLLSQQSDLAFATGVLALIEGNITEAEIRLRQALLPQNVNIRRLGYGQRAEIIERYLQIIERIQAEEEFERSRKRD